MGHEGVGYGQFGHVGVEILDLGIVTGCVFSSSFIMFCITFIEVLDGIEAKDYERDFFWGRERINVIGLPR